MHLEIRMKHFGTTMIVAATMAASWAASVQAADVVRAHYEIRVASNGSENTVRSTFETPPGQPFTLNLPPNIVAMSVKNIHGDNYELQVTVTPANAAKNQAVFSQVYQGVLGRPLELKSSANAVQVDGAISLVVLNKK
jgi:hypothetical protein